MKYCTCSRLLCTLVVHSYLNNLNNGSTKIKKEDARRTKYTFCSDTESWSIKIIRNRELLSERDNHQIFIVKTKVLSITN